MKLQNSTYLDLFICHASEDKEKIARPLKDYFDINGLNAWYDEDSILFSDSISKKIYKGIKNSKGAIIILSENFYKKEWAIFEFGGIVYKWFNEEGVLYLLYWDIDIKNVSEKLSFIGDIRSVRMSEYKSINEVAKAICTDFNLKKDEIEEKIMKEKRKKTIQLIKNICLIIGICSIILLLKSTVKLINLPIQESESISLAGNDVSDKLLKNKDIENKKNPITSQSTKKIFSPDIMKDKQTNKNLNNHSIEKFSNTVNSLPSFVKNKDKTEINIIIMDENCNIENKISSDIANIYSKKGKTNLIKSNIIKTTEFQELFAGDYKLIEKLKLNNYTNYIVLGKIKFIMQKGKLVEGTFICNALLTISIISTNKNTFKNFNVSGKGNGVSESQAQEGAINNLLCNYREEHSTL